MTLSSGGAVDPILNSTFIFLLNGLLVDSLCEESLWFAGTISEKIGMLVLFAQTEPAH